MKDIEILKFHKVNKVHEFYVYLTLDIESETFRIYFGYHTEVQTNIMLGPYQNRKHAEIAYNKTVQYYLNLYDELERA